MFTPKKCKNKNCSNTQNFLLDFASKKVVKVYPCCSKKCERKCERKKNKCSQSLCHNDCSYDKKNKKYHKICSACYKAQFKQSNVIMPGGMMLGRMIPGGMIPGGMIPGRMIPGGIIPGGMMPGRMIPGGIMPGRMMIGMQSNKRIQQIPNFPGIYSGNLSGKRE